LGEPDLIVVGGGIAGGALATVMARAGARVVLLERQAAHHDHVRGEILWPWGARLLRQLELEPVLLGAGAQVVRWLDLYDEADPGPRREDVAGAIAGIGGSINITHPAACRALLGAAVTADATVRMGVRAVQVTTGDPPSVRWLDGHGEHHASPAVVVGADGRRSSVRSQAEIAFEVDPPAHLITGMFAERIDGIDDDVNVIAREADLLFFSFPQGGGKARLYFCSPTDQRSRFSGRDGAQRFLAASGLRCLVGVAGWETAQAAGPCATFTAEDSRAPRPLAEGVVLIGDAGGYENPLQGQGLSMALQDAHDASAALLGPSPRAGLEAYASARATRQRLANCATRLEVWANGGFVAQDPTDRAGRYERIAGDEVLTALLDSYATGYDALPHDLTDGEFGRRLAAVS
jgi:2-polyprenyl-6-methoxyphenol hydroxylase-like FAD-dependent oxidoreductase